MPTVGQFILLMLAASLWLLGGWLSLGIGSKRSWGWNKLQFLAAGGLVCVLTVIGLHAAGRSDWRPMRDNFEALLWVCALISAFVLYVQKVKPIVGLDWFLMPVATGLTVLAALAGKIEYHQYLPQVQHAWFWIHRVASYAGTAFFAIAAGAAVLYLRGDYRLRRKELLAGASASLERLERVLMYAATLGFAFLTVSFVAGMVRLVEGDQNASRVKLALACSAWGVYAVVMHAPIHPSWRGRRAAWLSIVGFVLVVGAVVAVQFQSGGR